MLENEKIKLRAIEQEDCEKIRLWRTSSDVYMSFFEFVPLSKQQNSEFYTNAARKTNEYNFCIENKENNKIIGTVSIVNIDYRNRKAELGRVLIGEQSCRNKGFGKIAIDLVIEYAFKNLNIRKLYCEVFDKNEKAKSLYEKCGFIKEAVLKEHVFKAGKYEDVAVYSLFNKNFD